MSTRDDRIESEKKISKVGLEPKTLRFEISVSIGRLCRKDSDYESKGCRFQSHYEKDFSVCFSLYTRSSHVD